MAWNWITALRALKQRTLAAVAMTANIAILTSFCSIFFPMYSGVLPTMRPAMNTAVGRLVRAELRLMTRDPLVLTFVFAFPIVTMLIIGGAFGTHPDQAFDFKDRLFQALLRRDIVTGGEQMTGVQTKA